VTTPITIPPTGLKSYYLGVPGAMRLLRVAQDAVTAPASRGEVQHDLISGGTAVTHRKDTRRTWGLAYPGCTPDTADLLVGFYAGVFGDGPFCFVDPAWRNALHVAVSTFGAPLQAISGWSASVSAQPLTYDTTVTAPVATSGVMRWTGATNTAQVGLGTWSGSVFTPDTAKAPPYLPQQVTSISVYARSVSGTPSVSLRGQAVNGAGVVQNTQTATTTLSSAAWTLLTVTVPAALNASYVLPNLLCNTSTAVLQFACPLVQYGKSPPDTYVVGLGIPRVVIPQEFGGQYTVMFARDHGLTLAEI
jgi:hypothetical protein